MKKIYFILFVIVLFSGCYEDKGNYDYKELEGITVTLPETSYSLFFGDKLQITPIIESSIPDEDLAFDWGIEDSNVWYSGSYITIDSSRVLDFVCETDDYLLKQEGVYNLRLHVTQVSTGRNFYSDAISVKLSERGLPSYTGAIVLHGDGTSSDIGVIVADEFQLKGNSSNGKTQVFSHYYSEVNGEAIKGKGQWILQLYPYGNAMYSDNIVVVAVTDEGAAVTNKSMMKEGGW
ncbi:MAG: PKD-like family lipoprotein, partial [Butyricimonas faecihominis]